MKRLPLSALRREAKRRGIGVTKHLFGGAGGWRDNGKWPMNATEIARLIAFADAADSVCSRCKKQLAIDLGPMGALWHDMGGYTTKCSAIGLRRLLDKEITKISLGHTTTSYWRQVATEEAQGSR